MGTPSNQILLSADGQPLQCFGEKSWKQFEYKGYVVSLEMVEDEPAIVVWPASATRGTGVYAVCLSAFPYWIQESGMPTMGAVKMARRGLESMGRIPLAIEVATLMDVIIHYIPDVYRMPYFRKEKKDRMFDVTLMRGDKVVSESSV